jgi:hypothetical protein
MKRNSQGLRLLFISLTPPPPFLFYQVYISCWMQSAYGFKSDVIFKG